MKVDPVYFYLYYIGFFGWMLVPFRQYKGTYFYFFWMLAVLDPISYFFGQFNGQYLSSNEYNIWFYISFLTLLNKRILKKYQAPLVLIGVLVAFFSYYCNNYRVSWGIAIFVDILITTVILKTFLLKFMIDRKFNLFHFVFILYQFTLILKTLMLILDFPGKVSYSYFFYTYLFESFIAVCFCIFRDDSQILMIKLR